MERRTLLSAGQLDPTFGDHGVLRFADAQQLRTEASAAVELPDGRTLLAGGGGGALPGDSDVRVVARFDAGGRLDATFGSGGAVELAVKGYPFFDVRAMAVDASGRILVAGEANNGDAPLRAAVVRLTSDGAADRSFGRRGWAIFPFGRRGEINAMVVTPSGQIVVGGADGQPGDAHYTFALSRLTAGGALDTRFGQKGVARVEVAGAAQAAIYAMAVQPNGRIVAVGGDGALVAARVMPDGSADRSFGRGGAVRLTVRHCVGADDRLAAVSLRGDGEIFAAGVTGGLLTGAGKSAAASTVVALTARGALDASFGAGGVVRRAIAASRRAPSDSFASGISLTGDGRVVVAGAVSGAYATGPFVERLNGDGTADATFGGGGGADGVVMLAPGVRAFPDFTPFGVGLLAAPGSGGGYVVPFAGVAPNPTADPRSTDSLNDRLLAVRVSVDGAADAGYGGVVAPAGVAAYAPTALGYNIVRTLAAAPDGSIYVGAETSAHGDFVAKLHPDGTPDASFGNGGRVAAVGTVLATQPDGKVITDVGSASTPLVRFNADGTVDGSFAPDLSTTVPAGASQAVTRVLVGPGGVVLVEQSVTDARGGTGSFTELDLLTPTGRRIGTQRFAYPGRSATDVSIADVAFAPDGKVLALLVNGDVLTDPVAPPPGTPRFAVERFDADLTADATFGDGGVASLDVANLSEVDALAVSPDGRAYVSAFSADTYVPDRLIRLTAGGAPDAAFGPNGVRREPLLGKLFFEADGKLLAANGTTYPALGFARYGADGNLDPTFGTNGQLTFRTGQEINGSLFALQPLPGGAGQGASEGLLAIGEPDPSLGSGTVALVRRVML